MAPSFQNITISVPNGTSNHGDPHLLCTPSTWADIALFLFANFVAHAATVISVPGETMLSMSLAVVCALTIPLSGIFRGMNAIFSGAIFCTAPLERATRAGALCMVVHTESWEPRSGDKVRNWSIKTGRRTFTPETTLSENGDRELINHISTLKLENHSFTYFLPSSKILSLTRRHVFGICSLPKGYALSLVPYGACVHELEGSEERQTNVKESGNWYKSLQYRFRPDKKPHHDFNLNSSYSFPKGLIAIFQTVYGSITLYKQRGTRSGAMVMRRLAFLLRHI